MIGQCRLPVTLSLHSCDTAEALRRSALLGVAFLVVALAGCLSPREAKEARTLRKEVDAEVAEAEARLAALPVEQALLDIAKRQDARRDHDRLVEWTRHPSAEVRAAAARALAFVGDAAAGDVLVHLLEDDDDRVVQAAAFGLGQVGFWRVTDLELGALKAKLQEALATELGDCRHTLRFEGERTEVCRVVVRSLGAAGGEFAEDALWTALGKGIASDTLRRAVPLALAVMAKDGRGTPITAERLTYLAPLLIDADDPAQWAAAYLLARAEVAEEAKPTAAQLLGLAWGKASKGTARAWLLRALGRAGDAASREVLAGVLREPAAPAREVVAAARGASESLRDSLIERLDLGPPLDVAEEIVAALARLEAAAEESEAVRAHLGALLTADPEPTLLAALGPLVATGWRVDAVVSLLGSQSVDVRAAAAAALAAGEGEDVDTALLAALETETELTARIAVAVAVAERPGPAVEGALLSLVLDPEPILGAIAAEGLGPREGAHITGRLGEAWDAARGPTEWERRLAIAKALLMRDDIPPDRLRAAMTDSEPLVRAATERAVFERFDRAAADEKGVPRPLPTIDDHLWGVGDVRGAVVTTDKGALTMDLYPRIAPGTVANFVALAERDWFDGRAVHRVVEDFVVQTGDPLDNGWGGPGTTIRCETSEEPYRRGTVGMALSGRDTGGSQWFITHSPQPHLDGRYAVFGQVTDGWDVLDGLVEGDRVVDVTIVRASESAEEAESGSAAPESPPPSPEETP